MKIKQTQLIATMMLVACFTSFGVQAAPKSTPMGTTYRYIGNTTQGSYAGGLGLIGMNQLCQFDYGNEARMCTTMEFFQTPNPQLTSDTAWIMPSVGHPILDPATGDLFYMDYTGRQLAPGPGGHSVACEGWAVSTPANVGTIVQRSTVTNVVTVTVSPCSYAYPTACCTPQ